MAKRVSKRDVSTTAGVSETADESSEAISGSTTGKRVNESGARRGTAERASGGSAIAKLARIAEQRRVVSVTNAGGRR